MRLGQGMGVSHYPKLSLKYYVTTILAKQEEYKSNTFARVFKLTLCFSELAISKAQGLKSTLSLFKL